MYANTHEEIRLRCIEAASKFPNSHVGGLAAGVIEAAREYEKFVLDEDETVEFKALL